MKRLLDCTSSDFAKMSKDELLYSIAASEGRVLLCESIGAVQPMLGDITNAEFTASMGADILLLNMFDVDKPVINGLPKTEPQKVISKIKELTGRPVGINLEPVQNILPQDKDSQWSMTKGRKATLENAQKASDMGVDMILLTGNPGVGVTNQEIIHTLQIYKKELGDKVILAAGKMHASGILTEAAENIITVDDIEQFKNAGADVILLPAPGTVPGITMEYVKTLVTHSHALGCLTITAIGTSQEGADTETIRNIALMC